MKKIIFPVLIGLILLTGSQTSAQVYLFIDGVEGETVAKGLRGAIPIYNISLGGSSAVSGQTRTTAGLSAGKATFQDFSFNKERGAASSALQTLLFNGKNIPKAEIKFFKTGSPNSYFTITLENAMISSWTMGNGEGNILTESVSLVFSRMKTEDVITNPDGTSRKIPAGWDMERNVAY